MLWLYMASAGPERVNLGPKQENSIRLESSTLPAGRAHPRQAWHLAQQQAKPIWNLEKKYVNAFQDHNLLPSGIPLQQSCFLCPPSLCHAHPGEDTLPSLPLAQPCLDLGGSTLLYQRSCLRPKPYGFPFQSTPDTGSATGKAMSSLMMEPCLLPALVEEHSATGVKGSALSSGRQASRSYRPLLNNNSFLQPSSAKVPLLQSPEMKLKNTHSLSDASCPHSGGDGESFPGSLVNEAVKSSNLVLEQTAVSSLTLVPSGAILRKDRCSRKEAERRAHSLKEKEPEISLMEAVQPLAGQTATNNSFGREVESSGLTNVGSLSNWNSRWGQHVIAQFTPKETSAPVNSELGRHRLNGNSSLIGTNGAVVCTKRISVHLLASHAGSHDCNADCRLVSMLSSRGGDRVPKAEPLHLAAVSEVATQMSTIQLEKEEKQAQAELPRKLE